MNYSQKRVSFDYGCSICNEENAKPLPEGVRQGVVNGLLIETDADSMTLIQDAHEGSIFLHLAYVPDICKAMMSAYQARAVDSPSRPQPSEEDSK